MSSKSRGFVINHQRVQIELDFAGYIKGTTWLTIRPTEARLQAIYLHAGRALNISSVTLSADAPDELPELPATFVHIDPLSNAFNELDSDKLIDHHPDYKRRLWTAMAEADEGELCIDVRRGWVRLPELREGQSVRELAEFVVRIEYEVEMKDVVEEGVVFRRPGDNGLTDRVPHIFLNSSSHSSSRQWVPCVDTPWARHTWELEIIAPTYLQRLGSQAEADVYGESSSGSRRVVGEDKILVVASGELEEQITHPDAPKKTIWYYLQTSPLSVQHVTFAAGPFAMHHIPPSAPIRNNGDQDMNLETGGSVVPEEDNQPLMLAFSLPGYEVELQHTVACMRQAMDFHTSQYGSYPFSSFKMVFVEDPSPQCAIAGTMAVLSSELLYPPEVIEQAFITRPILTHTLASQWAGVNIVPRTYSDTWLTVGLALYMNAMFLRSLLGNNEYRYKLRSDIERCVALDRGEQFPLQIPGDHEPPDEARAQFIALKAPLVLHILDRRLAKVGTSLGLARIIPKLFLDSLSGDMSNNLLSTNYFLRTCKKASGVDMSGFQEEWIAGSGCPSIKISAIYKHGSGLTLNVVHKTPPAYRATKNSQPNQLAWKKPTQTFEGTLTVRIHEQEDPPAEHIIDIEPGKSSVELPYHTKDRRYRARPGPRKNAAERFAEMRTHGSALPEGVIVGRDSNGIDEREWLLSDFSEVERSAAEKETGFDWLSFDPDCEWICLIDYAQPEPKGHGQDTTNMLFWASQLRFDRDVIGQRLAIRRLGAFHVPVVSSIFTRTAMDDSYCIRIRMDAIEALTKLHVTTDNACPSLGAFHLLKMYQSDYCLPAPQGIEAEIFPDLKIVRAHYTASPPDAENVEEQLLYKAIVSAVSMIRFNKGVDGGIYAQTLVRTIIVSILDLAQPEGTNVSPSFTVASVISALSRYFPDAAVAPRKTQLAPVQRAVEMIQRWLSLDKLVPSYGNVVTIAGLQTLLAAKAVWNKGVEPVSAAVPYFLPYTREGNNIALRMVALDCVVACQPPTAWLTRYLLRIVKRDSSLTIRRHAADSLSRCWLLRLAIGEYPGLHAINAVTITEVKEGSTQTVKNSDVDVRRDIAAMRQLLADATELRSSVNEMLQFTGVGNGPLLSVLRAAEVVISAAPMKIRLSISAATQQNRTLTLRIPGTAGKDNQTSGQAGKSDINTKALLHILRKLKAVDDFVWFLLPVTRDEALAPGYYQTIKRPMDLGRIEQKLLHSAYTSRFDFRDDVKLVVRNAKEYNRPGEVVYVAAENLELQFDKQWLQLEKVLNAHLAQTAPITAASVPLPKPIAPVVLRLNTSASLADRAATSGPPAKSKNTGAVRFVDSAPSDRSAQSPKPMPSIKLTSSKIETAPKTSVKIKRERDLDEELLGMVDSEPSAKKAKTNAAGMEKGENPAKKQKTLSGTPGDKKAKAVKPDQARRESSSSVQAGPDVAGPSTFVKMPTIKLNARPTPSVPSAPVTVFSAQSSSTPLAPTAPITFALYDGRWDRLPHTKTPYRHLRGKRLLQSVMAHHLIKGIFDVPVTNEVAPGYTFEIKQPRDLSMISRKADRGDYLTVGALAADLRLVVANCRQYNGPASTLEVNAKFLEDKVLSSWEVLASPAPDQYERGKLNAWIEKAVKGNGSWFRDPVNEVLLPEYYKIIRREDARDFATIQKKLNAQRYTTYDELDSDVYQLCKNATTFNPPNTEPHILAVNIRNSYEALRKTLEASFRPRQG